MRKGSANISCVYGNHSLKTSFMRRLANGVDNHLQTLLRLTRNELMFVSGLSKELAEKGCLLPFFFLASRLFCVLAVALAASLISFTALCTSVCVCVCV